MRASFYLAILAVGFSAFAAAPAPEKIKVLIVDGQNNHNYKAMTPFMKEQLEKSGLFSVDVSTSPPASAKPGKDEKPEQKEAREKKNAGLQGDWAKWRPAFKDYQVVVSNYNGEAWPAEVNAAFEDFVKNGGGFYVVHAANNAFEGWKEYNLMIGLGWRGNKFGPRVFYDEKDQLQKAAAGEGPGAGHGAQHEFLMKLRDAEHPITKGLPPTWMHAADELYHGQRGPAENMQILASAWSDKAKGGTAASEPILWIIPYGKGKVVTNVMGHENGKAVQSVDFITLMNRSCEWLATGKVTSAVPENFPTPEKSSVVH
jgi:type 1 glutamine amidotransferase